MTAPVFVGHGGTTTPFTSTIVLSFNPGAAANRCILVLTWSTGDNTATVASIDYNGVGMTSAATQVLDPNNNGRFELFFLRGDSNIATGAHNITVNWGGSPTHAQVYACSYSGVDSSGPGVSGGVSNKANNQSPTWTISSATGDLAVVLALGTAGGHTWTPSGGVTIDVNDNSVFASIPFLALEAAGASSSTVSASISGSGDTWFGVGVSLKAVSGGGATAVTMSGPGSGTINIASSNFTIGVDSTPITGTVIVTPHTDLTGTFSPTTVSLTTGSPSATCTFTPTAAGVHSITTTNNGGLTNSTPLNFTAASAFTPYNPKAVAQPFLAQ